MIYVVDSADRNRLAESCSALEDLMKDERMQQTPLLILANKQDLEGAMSESEVRTTQIAEALPAKSNSERPWRVIGGCAKSRSQLVDCIEWLANVAR